ncbi:MAG: YceI family protein [Candidatus Cyclobacteriaceae bacterium M2_1C_046]
MRKLFFIGYFLLLTSSLSAQRFVSQEGRIIFFSDAVVEDIEAENKTGVSLIDFKEQTIVFLLKVRDFNFAKALMQEHFKEKYIEADKYPKSEFKGKFSGFDPSKSGNQEVNATGTLTIHGVTQPVEAKGIMRREGNLIYLKSEFYIKLADYNIKIPQVLWQNIAEEVLVTVQFIYRPYEK